MRDMMEAGNESEKERSKNQEVLKKRGTMKGEFHWMRWEGKSIAKP